METEGTTLTNTPDYVSTENGKRVPFSEMYLKATVPVAVKKDDEEETEEK